MKIKRNILKGFTLLEVIIAVFIISVALLGLVSMMVHSTRGGNFNKDEHRARQYAQSTMSELLSVLVNEPKKYSGESGGAVLTNIVLDETAKFSYSVTNVKANEAFGSDDTLRDIIIEITWGDQNGEHSYKLETYVTAKQ